MKRVVAIITSTWFLSTVGAICLGLILWFVGALFAFGSYRPLEGDVTRLVFALLPLVVVGIVYLWVRIANARKNRKMVATLTEAGGASAESAGEIEQLRSRIEEALETLKKSAGAKGGSRYLYQLPWYMMIGPPGAGKTTALKNSGLSFPLAAKYGKDAVRGVGGTRNCDWWFTDEAVLLDTAGRYTTQDSNTAVDQAAWKGFLGLLKKFRPRQPINGALVAISISDIATQSLDQRMSYARGIRQRLKELSDEFGVRFPVYVVFSKLDLIAGFNEFFDDLGKEDREQVWGMTFPLDLGTDAVEPAVTGFASEFDALIGRLNARLLERIQRESALPKRALIYAFPAQIASLKEPVSEFLNEIFLPNRYEGRPLLRGVYLTSATQEGTPIDRLMSAMASSFGLDRQVLSAFSGAGRSYFLTRVLRNVIFPEASLVGSDPRAERRQTLFRRIGYAASALLVVGCAAAWTVSYLGNRALIAEADGKLATYEAAIAPIATPVVNDSDLLRLLPPLRVLRTLPAGYENRDKPVPLSLTFGLYQGGKLGAQEIEAYRRALNTVFLPRLLVRLGNQIRGNLGKPEYVNEALKVYLMLGAAGPLDKGLVTEWLDLDWRGALQGPDKDTTRAELLAHLKALLEAPLQPIELDGTVISQGRRSLLQTSLASRAYSAIQQSPAARQIPEWRISEHAGPGVDRALIRNSGKLLSEGIPGFYTYAGFHKVLLPAVANAARDLANERWVLGDAAPAGNNDTVTSTLERDIVQLYLADYIARWDALLADINIVPFRSMQQAAEVTNILSGPDSPLKLLLTAAAQETELTRPDDTPAAGAGLAAQAAQAAAGAAQAAAGAAQNRLASIVGLTAAPQVVYGQAVVDHFQKLRDFVGLGSNGPAPIDDVIRSLNAVYLQLNGMSQPGQDLVGRSGAADAGAAQKLATDATRLPAPAAALVAAVAKNAATLTVSGAHGQINDNWQAKVLPFCQKALDDRYPIFHDSRNDVPLDDFAKLFASGGLIDAFFAANLKPFVDTSRLPWRWQKAENVDLGISPDVLVQFQRAAAIRDAFFGGSAAAPSLKFNLMPITLDAGSPQVLIDIDGQEITYAHGPQRPTSVQWPGPSGAHEGRVAFTSSGSGAAPTIVKEGPWSLFRLFDEGKLQATAQAERLRATFAIAGHEAVFEVQANSVNNPLTMPELREFRCPAKL